MGVGGVCTWVWGVVWAVVLGVLWTWGCGVAVVGLVVGGCVVVG